MSDNKKVGAVLVVGGGIGGIQASLDLAESGYKVYLLEEKPGIGGVMAQLDKTFPTNDCAMCIMAPKLIDSARHPNIELLPYSELEGVEGSAGNFKVENRKKSRYVDINKCTACGECAKVCPVERASEFDQGLSKRKAIYRLFPQGVPNAFAVDKKGYPPCRVACPAGVNAQGYIALISQGKFKEALEVVRRAMSFAAVCGRVCTHPCEIDCERGKVDEPIAIRSLKRFISDYELKVGREKAPAIKRTNEAKVAVIGSGPAGLACAYDLVREGYPVTVFESLSEPGGLLRYGIPEYRLPKAVLDNEIGYIQELGVEIKTGTPVKSLVEIFNQGYRAIFLASGAQTSLKMGIPGEDTRGVIHALSFLKQVNSGERVELGNRVAVIGGGNAAIDSARVALRLGAKEVTVVYRRSRAEMPAIPSELKEAEREGVRIHFLAAPVQVLARDGQLTGIECIKMKLGEPDASGRRRPIPIEGSQFTMDVDNLIIAIGQGIDKEALPKELAYTAWGTLSVDPLTLQTNIDGVFAGGDVVSGPADVIAAIAAGKEAAISVDRYLTGVDLKEGRPTQPKKVKEVSKEGVKKKARGAMPLLDTQKRVSFFAEVELGFDEKTAIEEAKRCLNCGVCSECLECLKNCQAQAINHDMVEEIVELEVGAIILAPGYDKFDPRIKGEYGYGRYKNVVTSVQFERILSPSGPFQGHLCRLSDGKEPKKIAFIQCVGSRDIPLGNNYCSSVCCTYAIKEAIVAKEHAQNGLETAIFFMDMRTYGKGFEEYYERAKKEYGVRFIRCRVSEIVEVPESQNLRVRYEDEKGKIRSEEFDLVVLSVGLVPKEGVKELAAKLGIELNNYGFCNTAELSPIETNKPGIFVCGAFTGPKDIPETVMQASGAAGKAGELLAASRGSLVTKKEYPPEIDVTGQEPRIGAFICRCGINIGGIVDVPSVVEYVKTLPGVIYAEENLYTCSEDTQRIIVDKIKEHNLNRIVVASCTPRTHEPLFRDTIREGGLNPYLFEMSNIREQCSWVHMTQPKEATKKAKDLVRMAVAKSRLLEPLYGRTLTVNKAALVIGGGLSGMTAALQLAEQGFETHLVEKEPELGGNLRHVRYLLDGDDPQQRLAELIEKVNQNGKIKVYTNTTLSKVEGSFGDFTSTLNGKEGAVKTINHGVIIVATGAEEWKPDQYLYGKNGKVLTQREFEERLSSGVSNAKRVVMIQCVGSREGDRAYCSRICCSQAIKNALKIKESSPNTEVYVLFRDIRTYGFKEEYYQKAREKGIIFIRYDEDQKPEVSEDGRGLKVKVRDPILDANLLINTDLLVLSPAIVANKNNKDLAQMLKIPLNQNGFFLEAHLKLRPVDFATEGIFLCGLAHSPKTIGESIAQACAAAARATTIISRDEIGLGATLSFVVDENCDGCAYCVDPCSFKAITLIEYMKDGVVKKTVEVDETACKGCGVCQATCPKKGIFVKGFKPEQIAAMVEAALGIG